MKHTIKWMSGAFFSAFVLIQIFTLQAAPGDLDLSFGGTGMKRVGFGHSYEEARAVALTADGKILLAGNGQYKSVVLGRFNTTNALDTTFGDNGRVEIPLPNYGTITTMAVQLDGKIVLGGNFFTGTSDNYDYLLIRCNADGTLDTSFGDGDGIVTTEFNGHRDECNSIVIQPDGKIVAAGQEVVPGDVVPSYHLSMARYNIDGSLDNSFGSSGRVVQTFASGYNSGANAIVQEGDGKILIGGFVNQFAVLRYTTNGTLDGTFGSGGVVKCTGYQAQAITIQPGGITISDPAKIVAAGVGSIASQNQAIIVKMDFNGVLDTTLNGTGLASTPVPNNSQITGVVAFNPFLSAKKIVISGYQYRAATGRDFFVAKFNFNGSLDTTFGGTGLVITDLGGDDYAYGMVVQPGLKLLLAGTTSTENYFNPDFALVRYNYSNGALDTNFNGTGILIQDAGSREAEAFGTAVQPDGKIVVAGKCDLGIESAVALCRFDASGELDPSFGVGGKVVCIIGEEASEADAVAIQPDGKIIVAGYAIDQLNRAEIMVARFLPTGILDPLFGTNGIVLTLVGTNYSSASAIAVQADGKILIGGSSKPGADTDFTVLRYTTNGVLDTSWNGTGKVFTGIGPSDDGLYSIKVQADGKVIAAGGSQFPSPQYKITMVRYNTNGTLDSSFGTFGRVAISVGSGTVDIATAMTLQSDGRIVLAGLTAPTGLTDADIVVLRCNSNGTLDATFDGDGKATTLIGLAFDYAIGVALQSDNKILAACRTQIGSYYKFGAARFLSNGSLDADYGFSGVTYFDFGTSADEQLNAMALDTNGRAVMVGRAGDLFGILRVLTANPTIQITSIKALPNGHVLLTGVGYPNASHTLEQSPTIMPANFTTLAPVTADGNGNWQFEDTTASSVDNRFYRLAFP